MRVFIVSGLHVQDALSLPQALPANGFVWVACSRTYFASEQTQIQASLQHLTGHNLLDLHISDLLNAQLPSRFDLTSYYDVLVFRRLATAARATEINDASLLKKTNKIVNYERDKIY